MEDENPNWEVHNPSAIPRGQQGEGNLQARQMLRSGSVSKILSKVKGAVVLVIVHVGGYGRAGLI